MYFLLEKVDFQPAMLVYWIAPPPLFLVGDFLKVANFFLKLLQFFF